MKVYYHQESEELVIVHCSWILNEIEFDNGSIIQTVTSPETAGYVYIGEL